MSKIIEYLVLVAMASAGAVMLASAVAESVSASLYQSAELIANAGS